MPSTLDQLSPTRAKLTIDLPFEDLQPAIDAAYKDISQQVNIPGFRKGKVPARLIDQRFGRGAVLQEAINSILPQAYGDAVQTHDLHPLGQPEVDVTELNDGTNVLFTAEVDVRPDFEIADMTGVQVEVPAAEVSDDDVNERVELLRERFATLTEVDRAAENGDVVVLNLKATQDGKTLDEAEASEVSYKVGAGGFVEGLDDAVVGLKAGEKATFTSTLVGGPNRGEEAEIEVEVLKVQSQELPDADDDFAQLVSEFDTADEMLADLRDNLERLARIDQANKAREQVLTKLIEATEFELPEALVTSEQENRRQAIEQQLNTAGLSVEQYLEEAEDEEAETPEAFWDDINQRVVEALRSQIILDKYAEDKDLQINQSELTELIFNKAQQNGTSPEQELQHMMEHDHTAEWMGEVRRGKALGELVAAVKVVDTDGNEVDVAHLNSDGTIADPATDDQTEDEAESPAEEIAEAADADDAPEADDEPEAAAAEDEIPAEKPAAKKKAPAKKPAKKKAAKADADE
ncbi:trigger factor [Propionimicrobium sp. PCR01-08-3]|uniref:trigger factor n=1 Tax=Propionimicrobium sp. PCR01-08-3 TaxID=3052086 RepID=UPI00255C60EE|nr:trigger factor [Propionimicrobium sp. PCR01-08-3]WIY83496.1 trigger factor [Propionimicrobium sp. PCR01-08-3]